MHQRVGWASWTVIKSTQPSNFEDKSDLYSQNFISKVVFALHLRNMQRSMMDITTPSAHCSTAAIDNDSSKRKLTDPAVLVSCIRVGVIKCMNVDKIMDSVGVNRLITAIQQLDQRAVCSVAATPQVRESLIRGLRGSMGLEVQQHAAGIVSVLTLQGGSAAWQVGEMGLEEVVSAVGSVLERNREVTLKATERATRILARLSKEEVTAPCLLTRVLAQRCGSNRCSLHVVDFDGTSRHPALTHTFHAAGAVVSVLC